MASRIFERPAEFPFAAYADSPTEKFTSAWLHHDRPLSESNILTLTRTIQTSHSARFQRRISANSPTEGHWGDQTLGSKTHRRQKPCFGTNPMSKTGLSRSVWVGPTSAGLTVSELPVQIEAARIMCLDYWSWFTIALEIQESVIYLGYNLFCQEGLKNACVVCIDFFKMHNKTQNFLTLAGLQLLNILVSNHHIWGTRCYMSSMKANAI